MAEYSREQKNKPSRTIANSETGNKQLKGFVDNRFVIGNSIMQRQLSISDAEDKDAIYGKGLLGAAYQIGLTSDVGELNFENDGKDIYGSTKYNVHENPRLGPERDGIGSHLIGKIIDDGNVHIYFGAAYNEAAPDSAGELEKADRGESCRSRILLQKDASAIELIHELIHSYHFAFDPWTKEQKERQVTDGDLLTRESAEEISTVGLGEWEDFELTENAFRRKNESPIRSHYADWRDYPY